MKRRQFLQTGTAGAITLAMPSILHAQTERTIVFRGGTILPVDNAFSEHAALLVRGNKIVGAGTDELIMTAAGDGAEIVDLDGRTALPGFIEPHMHLTLIAALGEYPDVGPFVHSTFEECLAALKGITAELAPDDWLIARQFDPSLLVPARELTVHELDQIAPDRPAFILNASGHIAYVNSKALELAGFGPDTEDPPGSELRRFDDGALSGALLGQAAWLPVLQLNQNVLANMGAGFGDAVVRAGQDASELGLTTMCDMAAAALSGAEEFETLRGLFGDKGMSCRLRSYIYDLGGMSLGDVEPHSGNDFHRVSGWKIVSDGSNQGYTGRQREPYHSVASLGLFYVEPDDLQTRVEEVARAGWQPTIHGNGDAAIDSLLNAVEFAARKGIDMAALRPLIQHSSILHDDQIARMAELGVSPSFLINHVHYWGHAMRDQVFGPRKVQLLDRCASVEKAGIRYTVHSDAPVSPLGPLHMVRVAVVRDLWKEPDTILAPDERVSVESAIRAQTINAAWQCHSENEIGSLEEGKLADMVILEEDPRLVNATDISDIKVSETWMDGKQVFVG